MHKNLGSNTIRTLPGNSAKTSPFTFKDRFSYCLMDQVFPPPCKDIKSGSSPVTSLLGKAIKPVSFNMSK